MKKTEIENDQSYQGERSVSRFTLGIQVGLKEKPRKSVKEIFSLIFSVTSSVFMLLALIFFIFQLFTFAFWFSLVAFTFLILRLPLIPFGSHFNANLMYGLINILLSFLFYSLMISSSI